MCRFLFLIFFISRAKASTGSERMCLTFMAHKTRISKSCRRLCWLSRAIFCKSMLKQIKWVEVGLGVFCQWARKQNSACRLEDTNTIEQLCCVLPYSVLEFSITIIQGTKKWVTLLTYWNIKNWSRKYTLKYIKM